MNDNTGYEPCRLPQLPNGWNDPVHEHQDGSWWWYDETWGNEYGPYLNQPTARIAIKEYLKTL